MTSGRRHTDAVEEVGPAELGPVHGHPAGDELDVGLQAQAAQFVERGHALLLHLGLRHRGGHRLHDGPQRDDRGHRHGRVADRPGLSMPDDDLLGAREIAA
jgi:hypothetical protein